MECKRQQMYRQLNLSQYFYISVGSNDMEGVTHLTLQLEEH